jgi:hypothetical protein
VEAKMIRRAATASLAETSVKASFDSFDAPTQGIAEGKSLFIRRSFSEGEPNFPTTDWEIMH